MKWVWTTKHGEPFGALTGTKRGWSGVSWSIVFKKWCGWVNNPWVIRDDFETKEDAVKWVEDQIKKSEGEGR